MQFFPENHHTKRQRRRRHLGICIVFCAVAGASVPRATAENECELIWSTYVGGGAFDYGSRVAADAWGNVYVTGGTESADFPVAAPGDVNYNGGIADAYVMKFAYNGSLLWSTYLGGSGEDHGYGIAVDISGKVYVTGYTTSTDFPVTPGCAYSSHSGGFDVFVAAFSAGGTPMWATYLGGSGEDRAYGAAVNEWGEVYIAGITRSNNFPMKGSFSTPYSGAYDAFVAKLSSDGNVVWSTYLGGTFSDLCLGVATGGAGEVCITGRTSSEDFPTTEGAFDRDFNGDRDVFVANFSRDGELLWSTYLGGNAEEEGYGIAAESGGGIYVTGMTSSAGFPATAGAYDDTHNGSWDAFLTKFDAAGNMIWSTFLGGTSVDGGQAVAADGVGNICLTGYTQSADFPVTGGFDMSYNGGGRDVFVSKFSGDGNLCWSTYLGGSDSDEPWGIAAPGPHHVYVVGMTQSVDFPVLDCFDADYHGGADAFVTKIGNPDADTVAAVTPVGLVVGLSIVLTISALSVRNRPEILSPR